MISKSWLEHTTASRVIASGTSRFFNQVSSHYRWGNWGPERMIYPRSLGKLVAEPSFLPPTSVVFGPLMLSNKFLWSLFYCFYLLTPWFPLKSELTLGPIWCAPALHSLGQHMEEPVHWLNWDPVQIHWLTHFSVYFEDKYSFPLL